MCIKKIKLTNEKKTSKIVIENQIEEIYYSASDKIKQLISNRNCFLMITKNKEIIDILIKSKKIMIELLDNEELISMEPKENYEMFKMLDNEGKQHTIYIDITEYMHTKNLIHSLLDLGYKANQFKYNETEDQIAVYINPRGLNLLCSPNSMEDVIENYLNQPLIENIFVTQEVLTGE